MSKSDFPVIGRTPPAGRRGLLGWLIERKRMLLPLTGLWILVLDWLLFSLSTLSLGLVWPIASAIGFVTGGVGTFYFQRRFAHDNLWKSLLKALLAGVFVGIPWPLAGTVLGGWVLLASGIPNPRRKHAHSRDAS